MSESVADKLRRAADKLEKLDGEASTSPWRAGRTILNDTGIHATTGNEDELAVAYWMPDATLICALRSVAAPLAAWLRAEANDYDEDEDFIPIGDPAGDIARAILGEDAT